MKGIELVLDGCSFFCGVISVIASDVSVQVSSDYRCTIDVLLLPSDSAMVLLLPSEFLLWTSVSTAESEVEAEAVLLMLLEIMLSVEVVLIVAIFRSSPKV